MSKKEKIINIPNCRHLVEWLRFIISKRHTGNSKIDTIIFFDFNETTFLLPYHLVSLACVIEEYKQSGAIIKIRGKKKSKVKKFLQWTGFDSYWRMNIDRNYCLNSDF